MSGIGSIGDQICLLPSLCFMRGASQSNRVTLTITALAVGIAVAGVFLLLAALQVLPSGQNVISRLGAGGIVVGAVPLGMGLLTLVCVIAQKLRAKNPPPVVTDPVSVHEKNFRIKPRNSTQSIPSSTHSRPAGATGSVNTTQGDGRLSTAPVVAQWKTSQSHYVAYRIVDKDISTALSRGYLAPEEYFHRNPIEILLSEEELECLKNLEEEIDQVEKPLENDAGLDERISYIGLGLCIYEFLKPIEQRWQPGSDVPNLRYNEMRFSGQRNGEEVTKFREKLEEMALKYSGSVESILLAYDQSKPEAERFDRKMSIYFEGVCEDYGIKTYYDPKGSLENRRLYRELVQCLENARVDVFQRRLVTPCMRATENQIHWKNERVMILQKNVAEQIASKLGVVGEVYLLNPWQNKGDFSLIPFDDPKTLILGPKAILEPFAKKNPTLQVAYFEDMTPEQCDDFNVPQKLRAT